MKTNIKRSVFSGLVLATIAVFVSGCSTPEEKHNQELQSAMEKQAKDMNSNGPGSPAASKQPGKAPMPEGVKGPDGGPR